MVSVIIPTYNRANTLMRSINSVLNQTYEDIELIVVDDCSTDDTTQVINSIDDKRVQYIRHDTNRGACAARNTGIAVAKGEFIAFQDSDDVWESNKLQLQMDKITEFDADICFCRIHRFGYPKTVSEFAPDFDTGVIQYDKLIMNTGVSTQTIVVKKHIAMNYLFDENVKRLQDYDWIIRAGENHRVIFVSEAIVNTYFQNDSISNTGEQTYLQSNEYFLGKYASKFDIYPQFRITLLKRIAYSKTVLNMDASEEYWILYSYDKSLKSWIKWILSKIGLLKYFKGYKGY